MTEPMQHPTSWDDRAPGPLGRCEDWLVAECTRVLGGVFRSIEAGPGEWSDDYLRRLVKSLPAVRVAWLDGTARKSIPDLDVDSRWAVYLLTGWNGQRESDRRRGSGVGAWPAATLLAPWLHACVPGNGVGQVMVDRIDNLWSGDLDRVGVALVAITLNVQLAFDPQVEEGEFDDFLRAGADWSLQGADLADIEGRDPQPFNVRPEGEG